MGAGGGHAGLREAWPRLGGIRSLSVKGAGGGHVGLREAWPRVGAIRSFLKESNVYKQRLSNGGGGAFPQPQFELQVYPVRTAVLFLDAMKW